MKAVAKYLSLIIVATLFLVGIVESTARVLITAKKDWARVFQQEWMEVSPTLGWKPRAGYKGWAAREFREFDDNGMVVRAKKYDGTPTKTILLIGDSCTYGLKVPSEATFGALLEEKLTDVQVVNLAVPGYSTYQGVEVLKDSLTLNPDLIIASFSFNDRRYVLNNEREDSYEKFSRYAQWSWILRLANISYLIQWFQDQKEKSVDLRKISVRVPYLQYRKNLEKMVALAKTINAPLIFTVMQDNPNFMVHTKRGLQLKREGKVTEAIDALKEAIAINPLIVDLPKLIMARAYETLGEREKANKVAMIRPRFRYDGGGPLRVDSQYAQVMLEVGKNHQVNVFDARQVLSKNPSVFFDVVHFDEIGHALMAQGLYEFIVQRGLLDENKMVDASLGKKSSPIHTVSLLPSV